ncbi:hypothetical protein DH2020_038128 [Rehmannia glutinosa]|uniref:ESF1 RRM domain-containing protein n=1 Tax=Rehmannia glutinosa TaxID=99300 RepID=A0ABR0V1D8_REHGL
MLATKHPCPVLWKRPPVNWLKVNIDGSFHSPNCAGQWTLRHSISRIKNLLMRRPFTLQHTHREANQVADLLAKMGRSTVNMVYFSDINVPRNGNNGGEGEFQGITDDRFKSAQSDPRFMEAPKKRSKVEIDSRFRRVFTDKSFTSSNAPVDKRGKPKNKDKAADSLKHYYRLQPKEDETGVSPIDEKEDGDFPVESDQIGHETESESEKLNEALEDDDDDDDGQSIDESSSTSTTDSDSDLDDQYMDDEEEDTLMQPEENVPEIDKETRRLAVVNLDWSQVRAVDLYVLLSSFLPKGGQILSVAVYPSEFGLKRMEEEAVRGPVGLFDEEEEEHDDGEDDEIDNNKLRAYELSRLRYYYAVVECDSSATADYLYNSCDGVEFERSANKLDLRFIPDSMDFKHQPRDVATEAPADYEGLDFQTRALQHSNIHLTWDEDEPQRAKTLKRKLNDDQVGLLPLCLRIGIERVLASDESETDDDDNGDGTEDRSLKKQKRDKYRALIQSAGDGSDEDNEEDNDQDMEVTFSSGLEDISKRILEKKDKKSETVWEAYLRKRKEKKKASKNGSKYSSEDSSSGDTDQEPEEQPDDFFVEEPSAKTTKKRNSVKETTEEDKQAEQSSNVLLLLSPDDFDPFLKLNNLLAHKCPSLTCHKATSICIEAATEGSWRDDNGTVCPPRVADAFESILESVVPENHQLLKLAPHFRYSSQRGKSRDQVKTIDIDPLEGSQGNYSIYPVKLQSHLIRGRVNEKDKPTKSKLLQLLKRKSFKNKKVSTLQV